MVLSVLFCLSASPEGKGHAKEIQSTDILESSADSTETFQA